MVAITMGAPSIRKASIGVPRFISIESEKAFKVAINLTESSHTYYIIHRVCTRNNDNLLIRTYLRCTHTVELIYCIEHFSVRGWMVYG